MYRFLTMNGYRVKQLSTKNKNVVKDCFQITHSITKRKLATVNTATLEIRYTQHCQADDKYFIQEGVSNGNSY